MSGPLPSVGFKSQVGEILDCTLEFQQSGQLTASKNIVLGAPRFPGNIVDAYLSLGAAGKNDTVPFSAELDVTIGGTSIFSTKPKISHVSGESSSGKSTMPSFGSTGITPGVINGSLSSYSAGSVIMGKVNVVRSGSPITEMLDLAVAVILKTE